MINEAKKFSLGNIKSHLDYVRKIAAGVDKLISDKQAMFRVEQDAPGALNALMRSIDMAYNGMQMADRISGELQSFARGEKGSERALKHLSRQAGIAYSKQTRGMRSAWSERPAPFNIAQSAKYYESTSALGNLMEDLRGQAGLDEARGMTFRDAVRSFNQNILPEIKKAERRGPDYGRRKEAWSFYVDGLERDGQITAAQAYKWGYPKTCERK